MNINYEVVNDDSTGNYREHNATTG